MIGVLPVFQAKSLTPLNNHRVKEVIFPYRLRRDVKTSRDEILKNYKGGKRSEEKFITH